MKIHWTRLSENKNVEYHIEIKINEKRILSWETTGHWKSETGGQISFEDFLKGDWDNWVTRAFGESILIEMKENIKSL